MSIDQCGTRHALSMRWAGRFSGAVSVLLLASATPGCGASGGTSTGPGPGLSDSGDATSEGRTNLPPGCPEGIPRTGDACALPNHQSCNYGCDRGDRATAICQNGQFSVGYAGVPSG